MRRFLGALLVIVCAMPCQAQTVRLKFPGIKAGPKNTKSVADLVEGITLHEIEATQFCRRFRAVSKCGVILTIDERRDAGKVYLTAEMPTGLPEPVPPEKCKRVYWTTDLQTWKMTGTLTRHWEGTPDESYIANWPKTIP